MEQLHESHSGLGLRLTWTRVATQCGGRNQTGVDLWWAQGDATTGVVTASFASAPGSAVIAVARYSGIAATNPVALLVAGNTNGVNGGCANGIDSSAYSFNVTTVQSNVLVVGAVALRTKTHTPGTGYTERAEVHINATDTAGVAVMDQAVPAATLRLLNGLMNSTVDWAVIGIELRAGGDSAPPPNVPDIDVAPNPYGYGEVSVGTTAFQTFTVRNLGDADLHVTAASLVGGEAGEFAITQGNAPFTVAPGATQNLGVRLAPTSVGVKSTALRLSSDDPDENPADVALSGTAVAPDIDVSPTAYDYGLVPVGANVVRTFAIRNLGTADLQVTGTSLQGGQVSEFAIVQGGAPFTVAAGATHNLDVRFAPTSFGLKTTTLRVSSNDSDENPVDVALSGTGSVVPDIDVAPNPYAYGSLAVGTTAVQTFAIRNLGNGDLQVSATSLVGGQAGEFAITQGGAPFTVAPGATHNLDVRFAPTTFGAKSTTLRLTSDDPDESAVEVAVSGTGLSPDIDVTPTPHNYGAVLVGGTAVRTFAVRNLGNADLQVTATSLQGGQAGEFAITQGGAPFAVPPGATHTLDVRFAPTSVGAKATTLRLASTDPDENPVDVPLSGTGVQPDIAVTPTSHDYGTQAIGTNTTRAFLVSNAGSSNLVVGQSTLTGTDASSFAFVSGQGGFTIAPGGTGNIEVRFSPLTTGSKSAVLTIPSNDPDENPVLVSLSGVGITIPTFQEVQQGGSGNSNSAMTASNLTGVAGHLYLAAVSTTPYVGVNTVSGLGLTWTRVRSQCGGRSQSGIDLWWAQGAASSGRVTANLAAVATYTVIAVARYSAVVATNPVSLLVAGNTRGANGACTGGTNSAAYSFGVTTTSSPVVIFGAVAVRNRTHTPGSGYTERAEVSHGKGADIARIAFVDRTVPVATSLSLNGSLSGPADWAVIGVVLQPD